MQLINNELKMSSLETSGICYYCQSFQKKLYQIKNRYICNKCNSNIGLAYSRKKERQEERKIIARPFKTKDTILTFMKNLSSEDWFTVNQIIQKHPQLKKSSVRCVLSELRKKEIIETQGGRRSDGTKLESLYRVIDRNFLL